MALKTKSWKNIFLFAGSFIACLIGAGFATGQEVLQYFAGYGFKGLFGTVVVFVAMAYVGVSFICAGQRENFKCGNDIYAYYAGKHIGRFYDYISIVVLYTTLIVVIAGGGATLQQHYGLSALVSNLAMGLITALTVSCGLKNVITIIGNVGPVKALLVVLLGLVALYQGPTTMGEAAALIPELDILHASTNWFTAAFAYVGFSMLLIAAFLTAMGKRAQSQREGLWSGILGAAGFSLGILVLAMALMANIEKVATTMIPTLFLAENIHAYLGLAFSIFILIGTYTSAVPLLWTTAARFAPDGSSGFKALAVALGIIATVVGLTVPYNKLVNTVYVINGYVGILFLLIMVYRDISGGMRRKHGVNMTTKALRAR